MHVVARYRYRARIWWLWLACSYRFRYAHRPLCSRFGGGVIKLGTIHLCRSCTCLYLAGLTAAVAIAILRPSASESIIALVAVAIPTVTGSSPYLYRKMPRCICDGLRAGMGVLIVLALYLLLNGRILIGAPAVLALYGFWRLYLRARRRARAQACETCKELTQPGICTGCQPLAEATRRFETTATQLYLASGQTPQTTP